MTPLFIDPSKTSITVQVESKSLHALGFEITVFQSDGVTVVEQFTGDTKTTNPFKKVLANAPVNYKGNYVRGTFTVISPTGADYPYSILFSLVEDAAGLTPNINLSDTTKGGTDTTGATYQLN